MALGDPFEVLGAAGDLDEDGQVATPGPDDLRVPERQLQEFAVLGLVGMPDWFSAHFSRYRHACRKDVMIYDLQGII